MKKLILIPILLGVTLLIAGSAVAAFGYIHTRKENKYVTNTHDVTKTFTNIKVTSSISTIEVKSSEDAQTKVVCEENEKKYHIVKVEEDTLKIDFKNELRWYERIFDWDFDFGHKKKVTIYLPNNSYSDLNIKTSTGSIIIPAGFTFTNVTAKSSTGSVKLESNVTSVANLGASTGSVTVDGINAGELKVDVSTGSIRVKNINVSGDALIKASTGSIETNNFKSDNLTALNSSGSIVMVDTVINNEIVAKASSGSIRLERSDADTLDLQTSSGSIRGTILTSKIFQAKTSTGRINVPETITGGVCKAKTSTGSINLSIVE